MDVAGSAVGIASLGIQVCQGLLWYYDAWKSYDSDISSTCDAITDLRDTLELLETILQEGEDTERVKKVKAGVNNCKDALLELDKRREKLQKYSQPEGLRQRMRAGLQRSWYPFRKDTLDALKASVTDVQERLKLALQVLQLDIGTESQKLVLRLLSQTTTQNASMSQIAAQIQRILAVQRWMNSGRSSLGSQRLIPEQITLLLVSATKTKHATGCYGRVSIRAGRQV
jgi:Ribonuclease G/E